MNWETTLLTYPRTVNPNQESLCHAILTHEGVVRLDSVDVSPDDLIAGIDYEVGTGDSVKKRTKQKTNISSLYLITRLLAFSTKR